MAVSLRHRLWQATVWITNRISSNNSLSFSFCERTLKLNAKGYDDNTNPSFLAPQLRSTRPTLLKISFALDRFHVSWPVHDKFSAQLCFIVMCEFIPEV